MMNFTMQFKCNHPLLHAFLSVVGCMQVIFLVLFWVFFDYANSVTNSTAATLETINHHAHTEVVHYYKPMIDVGIMCFVGFGFLMTFLRRYGYSAFGLNFFISGKCFCCCVADSWL